MEDETQPVDADSIAKAANEVASATKDGQSATAVPIQDQIAAAKFAAANNPNRKRGPRMKRVITGDC